MIHAFIPGTPVPPLAPTVDASGVSKGARVACVSCGARRSEREQWRFTGREAHWGYVYLVWTRDDGKRYARWVE